jgi:hypothetical protein
MAGMDSSIKLTGVEEALERYVPEVVRKATNATLNRVAVSARQTAIDLIQTEYNFKPRELRMYLLLSAKAKGYSMEAVITGKKRGTPLFMFGAKQEGVTVRKKQAAYNRRARRRGALRYGGKVTVLVKRGGGRKVVSPVEGVRPFIAKMTTGHIGVWARRGGSRLPIEQLYGPGVGGLFGSEKIMSAVKRRVLERWPKEFQHQLDFYAGRLKK